MSVHQDIKDTLESPGMKHIVRELRAHHKMVYRKYRDVGSPEQLLNLQTIQKVIDTTIPSIIEKLMNKHVVPAPGKPMKQEWFFMDWINKIRHRPRG